MPATTEGETPMPEKTILEAVDGAPEAISVGNFRTVVADGKYETDSPVFAEYLVLQGFAKAPKPLRRKEKSDQPEITGGDN
jgi:hypothetical protein